MSKMVAKDFLKSSILAGSLYFVLVFTLGFLLGTLRTVFLQSAPGSGRLIGVLIELPIMIAASWYLCGYCLRRLSVDSTLAARALMGALAFVLLLVAEMMLGAVLFGRTPLEHFALYRDASYALGLAGQIGFALMPLIRMGTRR